MVNLLDKINNWTQSGPAGNDLRQDDWNIEDLIGWSIEGNIDDIVEATGFVPTGQGDAWAEDYGAYIHSYNPEGERMSIAAFETDLTANITQGVTDLWSNYATGSKSGFASSYGSTQLVENTVQNTSQAIALARKAKDQAIFNKREDWVDSLWDTMTELADMGAFCDESYGGDFCDEE